MINALRWLSLLSAIPLMLLGIWYFIEPAAFNRSIILPLLVVMGVSTTLLTILSVKKENQG